MFRLTESHLVNPKFRQIRVLRDNLLMTLTWKLESETGQDGFKKRQKEEARWNTGSNKNVLQVMSKLV